VFAEEAVGLSEYRHLALCEPYTLRQIPTLGISRIGDIERAIDGAMLRPAEANFPLFQRTDSQNG
jgi:hypothetical protein